MDKISQSPISFIILAVLVVSVNCGNGKQNAQGDMMTSNEPTGEIRKPVVAGQFYTDDPYALRVEINGYIDSAEKFAEYEPIAVVSPHAGYVFSGSIAGYSYKQLQGRNFETVVVISPSHTEYFNFCSVMDDGAYQTPLGQIKIDNSLAEEICAYSDAVKPSRKGHFSSGGRGEHALEVQLPFLQIALGEFKLVPIVMGEQDWYSCYELGTALGKALKGKNAIIVASSDLAHVNKLETANRMDNELAGILEENDPEKALQAIQSHKVQACGGGPIAAAMIAANMLGAEGLKVLKQGNSGDSPYSSSDYFVGYLSAVMYKTTDSDSLLQEAEECLTEEFSSDGDLTLEEKKYLMEIAKTTVDCVVKGKKVPTFTPITDALDEDRGAFVTLKIDGRLRGCIGFIVGVKPLYQTVREMAESAALKDPRFSPVSEPELSQLEYEISALSPIRNIMNVEEIEVGKHGIIMRRGYNQGLLLPQVATEYGWDRIEFLMHTCQKAGLPPDAWQDPNTEISIFSAEVFGEEDLD